MNTYLLTVIRLEATVCMFILHNEVVDNENFCGDEDLEGDVVFKISVVNEVDI